MEKLRLNVTGMSPISESEASATASPARGRETRTALLQRLRPPPLVHAWDFWHEKPKPIAQQTNTVASAQSPSSTIPTEGYNPSLALLHSVTDVRTFWTLFNNFSFSSLPPKTSVHLFHKAVKPVWEDSRNIYGGAWTFRLSRTTASKFFRSLALLAIGEKLQEAVTVDPNKLTFRDDICGISYVVKNERTTAVQVWNRDAGNEEGIKRLLTCILDGVDEGIKPRESQYYYKKHKDHAGFASQQDQSSGSLSAVSSSVPASAVEGVSPLRGDAEIESPVTKLKSDEAAQSVQTVEQQYEKVRKILEDVKLKDAEMEKKLVAEIEKEEDAEQKENALSAS